MLVSAAACGGSDQPAKSPEDTAATTATVASATPPPAPPEPVSPAGASTTGREGDPQQSPPAALSAGNGPAPTEVALTDEQILEITHTANVGEIEQAKLAQTKSKDAHVKKFAAAMVKDHSDADAKGTKLAKKASLTPAASPASTSLESDAQNGMANLKTQAGTDFDKAYVDLQVKEHQAVLDALDEKLIPNAKNADLKTYLADVRTAVSMHLQHAKDLQTSLEKPSAMEK
jgi:putative membrane protein